MTGPVPSPGTKMVYLIKRRPETSRDELVAHWFANHMPLVIKGQERSAAKGRPHAHRYIATLFDADPEGEQHWDGMAQLWWEEPLPRPDVPHGTDPTDSFQQKAEPYVPWATNEYVIIDGSEHLPVDPLTLNPPFPCTRSGFLKVTFLVRSLPGTDHDQFFTHWLDRHVPNVRSVMNEVGGFRYTVSLSAAPDDEPFAGMAEFYFDDDDGWRRYRHAIEPDGMAAWIDPVGSLAFRGHTEMIGIA